MTVRSSWLWVALVVTVAAFAVTVAASSATGGNAGPGLGELLFLASSGHVASTGALLSCRELRAKALAQPSRFLIAPGALIGLGIVSAVLLSPRTLDLALLGFF